MRYSLLPFFWFFFLRAHGVCICVYTCTNAQTRVFLFCLYLLDDGSLAPEGREGESSGSESTRLDLIRLDLIWLDVGIVRLVD